MAVQSRRQLLLIWPTSRATSRDISTSRATGKGVPFHPTCKMFLKHQNSPLGRQGVTEKVEGEIDHSIPFLTQGEESWKNVRQPGRVITRDRQGIPYPFLHPGIRKVKMYLEGFSNEEYGDREGGEGEEHWSHQFLVLLSEASRQGVHV